MFSIRFAIVHRTFAMVTVFNIRGRAGSRWALPRILQLVWKLTVKHNDTMTVGVLFGSGSVQGWL